MDRHAKLCIWKWALRLADVALLIVLAMLAGYVQGRVGAESVLSRSAFALHSLPEGSGVTPLGMAVLVLLTYLITRRITDPIRRRIMSSWQTAGPRITRMCFTFTLILLLVMGIEREMCPGRWFIISYFLLITLAEVPFRYLSLQLVNEILEDAAEIRLCEKRWLNRLLDIVVSFTALLTVFPLLYVLAAIIIKVRNTGPVLVWEEMENGKGESVTACHFRLPSGMSDSWLAHMPRFFAILRGRMALADMGLARPQTEETSDEAEEIIIENTETTENEETEE